MFMTLMAQLVFDGYDIWWLTTSSQHLRIGMLIQPGHDNPQWEVRGPLGDSSAPPSDALLPAIPLLQSLPHSIVMSHKHTPIGTKLQSSIGCYGRQLLAGRGSFGQLILESGPLVEVATGPSVLEQLYQEIGRAAAEQRSTNLAVWRLEWERQGLPSTPTDGEIGYRQLRLVRQLSAVI